MRVHPVDEDGQMGRSVGDVLYADATPADLLATCCAALVEGPCASLKVVRRHDGSQRQHPLTLAAVRKLGDEVAADTASPAVTQGVRVSDGMPSDHRLGITAMSLVERMMMVSRPGGLPPAAGPAPSVGPVDVSAVVGGLMPHLEDLATELGGVRGRCVALAEAHTATQSDVADLRSIVETHIRSLAPLVHLIETAAKSGINPADLLKMVGAAQETAE
jgi:hypothetical protein